MNLSVCITVKNRSRVGGTAGMLYPFPVCARSVCKAVKGLEVELVVVDWGSTDWPLSEWLDQASGDVPVQLIRTSGPFCLGTGRNLAAKYARGDVLFFLDADTLVDRKVVREGLKAVAAGRAFFPVCSYYSTAGSQKAAWALRGYGNCMLAKEMFTAIGSWPEIPADSEDTLFHARAKELFTVARPKLEGLVHPWHPHGGKPAFVDWAVQKGWLEPDRCKLIAEAVPRGSCPTQALLNAGVLKADEWVHGPRRRFAFVADVPGWAMHRAGLGIGAWHGTQHAWDVFCLQPDSLPRAGLEAYDLVRCGGVYNFVGLLQSKRLPSGPRSIVSVASFVEIERMWPVLQRALDRIAAFAVLDRRLVAHVAAFGKPILYVPDRCDFGVFYPMAEVRPATGPLRVGWTGSEAVWGNQKHVGEITEACAQVGIQFVRQDRETDGALSTAQLREWYNSLDAYISANDVETLTPVTALEAVGCGLPVLTTRCGELWQLLAAYEPRWLIEQPTVAGIVQVLERLVATGRAESQRQGITFRQRHRTLVDWRWEASLVVTDMAALVV